MPRKMIMIFDLDGTVIDTSHRYRNNAEGHCDLEFWFANSTPEMIAQDKLLPLAEVMQRYYDEGHTIVVCTARDFSPLNGINLGDVYVAFLRDNNLRYHALLHRLLAGPGHATMGDGELKTRLLNDWAAHQGLALDWRSNAQMFDDNLGVVQKMMKDRLFCHDANKYNARLAQRVREAA